MPPKWQIHLKMQVQNGADIVTRIYGVEVGERFILHQDLQISCKGRAHSQIMMLILLLTLLHYVSTYSLQVTSDPPLLDVPTYSLSTKDASSGKTGMNILTYATPVSVRPDRIWSIGLFKGTVAHENFAHTRRGVLQLLSKSRHENVVKLLGGSSGRDVNKEEECAKLGLPWMTQIQIGDDCDPDMPALLPGCASYLRISLVGDLIDCGSHDVALCKIEAMYIGDDTVGGDSDGLNEIHLNTAYLREKGIITKQGRAVED